jgi:hypothetical protein
MVLTAAAVRAEEDQKPIEPKEKIELFNGKDMDGWVSHLKDNTEASKVWSVKDGLLLCAGKPNGYLRTEKSYAKEMNKTTGGSLTSGQIGIQCEGAELEVRRVTLEPLAP